MTLFFRADAIPARRRLFQMDWSLHLGKISSCFALTIQRCFRRSFVGLFAVRSGGNKLISLSTSALYLRVCVAQIFQSLSFPFLRSPSNARLHQCWVRWTARLS